MTFHVTGLHQMTLSHIPIISTLHLNPLTLDFVSVCACGDRPSQELDLSVMVMWNGHVASLLSRGPAHCIVGMLHPTQTHSTLLNIFFDTHT